MVSLWNKKNYTDWNTFKHSCRVTKKKKIKWEYIHFSSVQSDMTPWAISLFPKLAGEGPVWHHPAKLDQGTNSNSSTASRPFLLTRTQISHLLQFSSIKTKLTTNSFLIILIHILYKANVCEKHFEIFHTPYVKTAEENQVYWAAELVNFLLWLWIASSSFLSDMVTY